MLYRVKMAKFAIKKMQFAFLSLFLSLFFSFFLFKKKCINKEGNLRVIEVMGLTSSFCFFLSSVKV